MHKTLIAATSALILTAPAIAKAPKESSCSLIRKTEDGKFTYAPQLGWSLYREQMKDGMIEYDADVAGIACLRSPMTLTDADAETLSQGKTLTFSDPKNALTIVRYEAVEGNLVWKVISGSIKKSVKKKIEKSVARVQAKLAAM